MSYQSRAARARRGRLARRRNVVHGCVGVLGVVVGGVIGILVALYIVSVTMPDHQILERLPI